MDFYIAILFVILAIFIGFLWSKVRYQGGEIDQITAGLKNLQQQLNNLKDDLIKAESWLRDQAQQAYQELKDALDQINQQIQGLQTQITSILGSVASLQDDVSTLQQNYQDLLDRYNKFEKRIETFLQALCNVPGINQQLATKFTMIDAATCKLKPIRGNCPRGYYTTDDGPCRYKMCPGGDADGKGRWYSWKPANAFCVSKFGSQSGCDSTNGVCKIPPASDPSTSDPSNSNYIPCGGDTDCPSGMVCPAYMDGSVSFCTAPCTTDGDCPSGMTCPADPANIATSFCVLNCLTDADCPSGLICPPSSMGLSRCALPQA